MEELLTVHPLRADPRGRLVAGPDMDPDVVIEVPPVLPPAVGDVVDWLDDLPDRLGLEVVVLLRAGRAALGLWRDDLPVAQKVFKRYVVRGHGKAQPLHLRSRGKSRYGSRLRLQQARRLLADVNSRLLEWERDEGPFDAIRRASAPRLWAELCAAVPPPPFQARDPRIEAIAVHVHEPGLDELWRVRQILTAGKVIRRRPHGS